MSSKFKTKRDSLELFLKEQIIGPGGFNKRFFLLSKWASNEFAGKELNKCHAIENISEVISEVPAYQYSSAILFPISLDADSKTTRDEDEEDEESEFTNDTDIDVGENYANSEPKADDEKFQDDHTESVSSKNQNYPNTCGIAFAVVGNSILENDLDIKLRLRTYEKLSQEKCKDQKLGYSVKTNHENISRIIKQYFDEIFTIENLDGNVFVCLRNGVDINFHLYSLDYVNLENLLKLEIIPELDEIFPSGKFYKLSTKTYDGVTYEFHNLYEGSLTDEIADILKKDKSLYSRYSNLIDLVESYFQVKEIVTELKTIYRKNSKRNIPTQIWESIPFFDEFRLPPFDQKEDVSRGEFSIQGLNNLSISYQYLRHRAKNLSDEVVYIKVILVNRNEIKLKPNEPPQLNKKNKANRKSFFGVHLSVYEVKAGTLLPYNPPNLLQIDQESNFTKLLYRRYKDYGEGYNTSVGWGVGKDLLKHISTEFIPEQEIPKVDFKPSKLEGGKIVSRIDDNILLMHRISTLSKTPSEEIISDLTNFVGEYRNWISEKESELDNLNIENGKDLLERQLQSCLLDYKRLMRNILLLKDNTNAMTAFRLMNTAMFMQLHHGINVKSVSKNGGTFVPEDNNEEYYRNLEAPYKWRSFQIAFILLNIDGFVQPGPEQQVVEDVFKTGWPERNELADLVWFPTGGGKTEAYLGIIAFAIAYRRFTKGSKGFGTTVLMRYTLRLLTLQQFQRATLLICALEVIRKERFSIPFKLSLGDARITIGLFVGGDSTPNWWSNHKNSMSDELIRIQGLLEENRPVVTKLPHTECPWCGGKLFVEKDLKNIFPHPEGDNYGIKQKLIISCNTKYCTFHDQWLTNEDNTLPLALFDEDLYKFPPTLLFGTVDKFAALANRVSMVAGDRNQDSRRLFGKGFQIEYLPPELIIQDELHLLLGPLGSAVGLFERAIDELCTRSDNGKTIRPKIITSTATTRNTDKQIFALFNRRSEIFPKQGIDCDDSFFAYYERDEKSPYDYISNRKYMGLLPIGKTQVWMQLRVASICLTHRLKFMHDNRGCKVNCVKVGQTLTLTHNEKRRTIQFRGHQEESPGAVPLG